MRTTMQMPKQFFLGLAAALATGVASVPALWAAPPMPSHMDADYDASGFVVPAGMPPIGPSGPVAQAGFQTPMGMPAGGMPGGIQQVGLLGPGPAGGNGCMDCSGFGCNRCTGDHVGSGILGHRSQGRPGLLRGGRLGLGHHGCSSCGGGACGPGLGCGYGVFDLSRICLFCRGGGCGLCQSIGNGQLLGALRGLLPYSDAGLCAQRWYDVSAEAIFLGRRGGISNGALSRLDDPTGAVQLSGSDADLTDLEAGFRLSGAMIFGAGGNLELTYMGIDEWEGSAVALAPGTLQSFISDFGTAPPGGFADVDNANSHSISASSTFHSGEINYRRRTVGPYCRFQGSWLGGLRYLRIDDDFQFAANANPVVTPDSFFLNASTKNELFGPQIGGDLWWNVIPGINLGLELKGSVMNNDVRRAISARSRILDPARVASASDSETTVMGEMTLAMIYRFSHSWSLRTSYYVMGVDEIAGGIERSSANTLLQTPQAPDEEVFTYDRLTISGVTIGAEYLW